MLYRQLRISVCSSIAAFLGMGIMCFAQAGSTGHAGHMSPADAVNTTQNITGLNYATSWIGNTYGGNDADPQHTMQHVPLDMNGIYATPDGKVYTNTPWEEGGRPVSIFQDGKLISPLDDGPGSQNWSNGGGVAVASNGTYIFRGNGPNGTGVTILAANTMIPSSASLNGSSTLNNSYGIYGMAIAQNKLYVTEDDENVVDVFDLANLSLIQSFSVPHPVRIAVDSAGGIWVSHRDENPLPALDGNVYDINGQMGLPTIDHYDSSGDLVNTITLPDNGEVGALWIDQHDFLLAGDDGPDQNIKVYGNLPHNPQLVFTLGVKGGNYADGNTHGDNPWAEDHGSRNNSAYESGQVAPLRFRGITGIATDAQDNIYVSQSGFGMDMGVGHGAILQSYTWRGQLNWQVNGLEFVSLGAVDPQSQYDFYDAYHHFKVDYNKSGSIGYYVADTYNRFLYPDDVRVTSIASTGRVQYIQGKKFLLVSNQGGSFLEIDRFKPGSEIAVPSVAFDHGALNGQYQDFAVQPLYSEFIWRDLNGDGQMSMNEFLVQPPLPGCTTTSETCWMGGNDYWVDTNGDVWQVIYNRNIENSIHVRRYAFQGFDAYDSPIYDYDHKITYSVPGDFPNLTDVESVVFNPNDSAGGTLYAGGDQSSLGSISEIQRIDHWDKGNRTPAWTIDIPWDPDQNNLWQPNSFSVSGDFVFIDYYRPHIILIFSAKNGAYVGKFTPGADVGGVGRTVDGDFLSPVGDTDEWQGVSSYRRPDGQYMVVNEDDYQAKQLVYQWTPPSSLPTPPVSPVPTDVVATGGDESATLTWTGGSTALIYNVSRSTTPDGPYTLVDSGVVGTTVTDYGLINGQTYYYVVSSLTETGPSANSQQVSVTAVPYGTTYEAENGALAGGAQVFQCPGTCSNGARAGAIIPGATVTLSGVTVPTAGIYAVRVYFTNDDNTPSDFGTLDITVNGSLGGTITSYPFTDSWSVPGYTTVNLQLNAGANTVVLGVPASSSGGAPDIDRIVVPPNPN